MTAVYRPASFHQLAVSTASGSSSATSFFLFSNGSRNRLLVTFDRDAAGVIGAMSPTNFDREENFSPFVKVERPSTSLGNGETLIVDGGQKNI